MPSAHPSISSNAGLSLIPKWHSIRQDKIFKVSIELWELGKEWRLLQDFDLQEWRLCSAFYEMSLCLCFSAYVFSHLKMSGVYRVSYSVWCHRMIGNIIWLISRLERFVCTRNEMAGKRGWYFLSFVSVCVCRYCVCLGMCVYHCHCRVPFYHEYVSHGMK